jgi:trimeric autotransporter adhesin
MRNFIKFSIILLLITSCKSTEGNEPITKEGLISTNIQPPLTEQDKITASDNSTDSYFGESMSVSNDGKTLIVGAWLKPLKSIYGVGAAYIFVKENNKWREQAKISPPEDINNRNFGKNLAISGDGNTVAITCNDVIVNYSSIGPGIYIFARSGTTWTLQKRIVSRSFYIENYGSEICLSSNGDILFVDSKSLDITKGTWEKFIQVYKRFGNDWLPQPNLTPSDKDIYSNFGKPLAMSKEGTLMVGAPIDSSRVGSIYSFRNTSNTWIEESKIRPINKIPNSNFGGNISISSDGNTALTTAANPLNNREGIFYILKRVNNTWQQMPIGASDSKSVMVFGINARLSANGQNAVIVSQVPYGNLTAFEIYYYVINGNSWSEQKITKGNIMSQEDRFGTNAIISPDGNTVFIAAPHHDLGVASNAGAVYIYSR